MAGPYYIGDEVSAAAFRLVGARAIAPRIGEESAALAAARADASLVLISAAAAARIPAGEIDAAQAALAPLTLVVPDLREEAAVPDLASRLRRQLGLDAA